MLCYAMLCYANLHCTTLHYVATYHNSTLRYNVPVTPFFSGRLGPQNKNFNAKKKYTI